MKNVILIGLGPHAKRIYLEYFKSHKVNLPLVIDLDSTKDSTRKYLDDNGFKNTSLFTIDDKFKDEKHLPKDISNELLKRCKTLEITHIIISTEPKAHYMYIEFGLKNNLNVLTDKPIVVTKNMTSLTSIEKIRKEYYEILELSKKSKGTCKVMCQRQYHKGYEKIKEILESVVNKYKVPITNIEIFHSDGAWEMPHDMEKENHPYKYGYGKLFSSGYHFIDLLSDLIKINDSLTGNKKIVKGEVYSKIFTPNDEINILNIDDYKRLFKKQDMPNYYQENPNPKFDNYGEKDFHGLLTFYNKTGLTITTASLNLLHNGVSRRSWIKTRDFYKSNGRIRHERINIEIAHLINIQVHSYQSKEIIDRTENENNVGGLEHFDIYVFSNPLIHKKPFEEFHLSDMYSKNSSKTFSGYNELSRETFITNFLNNKECKGDIKDQALAIEILYSCSKGIHNHYKGKNKTEKIEVRNDYTYPLIAKKLEAYSNYDYQNLESENITGNIIIKDIYTFYSLINYIPELNEYIVSVSLDDTKHVVGGLLLKKFKNKLLAYLYYTHINETIKHNKVPIIKGILEDNLYY